MLRFAIVIGLGGLAGLGLARTAAAQAPTSAETLRVEGARQLRGKAYDQALANFLASYAEVGDPMTLLDIASTLRAMHRLADAANTYQRYLLDPTTGVERMAEVNELLVALDAHLTVLTVRVASRSEVSIDRGPYVAVEHALLVRVAPGAHGVKIVEGDRTSELAFDAVEGEAKELGAANQAPPDVHGWLITGTDYLADGAADRSRTLRAGPNAVVATDPSGALPKHEILANVEPAEEGISSGLVAVMRIDGKGRGFAGGGGFALSRTRYEGEIMLLKSAQTGGYLGVRVRLLNGGTYRPYVGAGMPGFLYDGPEMDANGKLTTHLAIGARIAGGLEVMLGSHFSVAVDLGYEHFFNVGATNFEADEFVPTVAVTGRI